MPKTLIELRSMDLEEGYGATATEIAACIMEDQDFDERVTQVSPKRFETIMSAYKKKAFKEAEANTKKSMHTGGKVFKDTNDYYLADHCVGKLTIEALEYGGFKIPGEKSAWEKAVQGKKDLMQYLISIDSPHTGALSLIKLDETKETLTLDKFISSKKDETREEFSSYRGETYPNGRFNDIFSRIKKEVKTTYENIIKDEARRVKKGELLLSLTQKINVIIARMNKHTAQQTEALEYMDNAFKEKAQHAQFLTQKHNSFHKNTTLSTKK